MKAWHIDFGFNNPGPVLSNPIRSKCQCFFYGTHNRGRVAQKKGKRKVLDDNKLFDKSS